MSFDIDGLDEFQNQLESVDGQSVSFDELFDGAFMRRNTEFGSMDELIEESQWTVESEEDFEEIPEDEFDEYIAEHTRFPNWDEMLSEAADQWIADQLGL